MYAHEIGSVSLLPLIFIERRDGLNFTIEQLYVRYWSVVQLKRSIAVQAHNASHRTLVETLHCDDFIRVSAASYQNA